MQTCHSKISATILCITAGAMLPATLAEGAAPAPAPVVMPDGAAGTLRIPSPEAAAGIAVPLSSRASSRSIGQRPACRSPTPTSPTSL